GKKFTHRTAQPVAGQTRTSEGKRHVAIVFGVGLFEVRADRVQISNRLCRSNTRLQMSHHHQNAAVATLIQDVQSLHLLLVHDRHPEIRSEKQQGSLELMGRYAEDGERM